MTQDLHDVLNDPDYDQDKLKDWFRSNYQDSWESAWNHYMETGDILQ